jgi:hypothetical protein
MAGILLVLALGVLALWKVRAPACPRAGRLIPRVPAVTDHLTCDNSTIERSPASNG